jgi:uncharacterized membrane protein YeaQ/YmgE (transglycosylase-associated protein family)
VRAGNERAMGLVVSILIAAVGLILALAIHPVNPGSVDVNTVGWILFVVGVIGAVVDLVLWSPRGPAYLRRTYVDAPPPRAPRRRIVEEIDEAAPPPF